MKNYILVFFVLTIFVSCGNLFQKTYDVSEILEYNARDLEQVENFKIKGQMGNSINLGVLGINAFALRDLKEPDKIIYVHTSYNTMPANKGETLKLDLKLWKEINVGFSKFYLFEEIKNKE